MNLTHDAMLVSLRINAWSGRLYDRQASNHVAAHHDASASAGRYNKRLLPKAAFAALTACVFRGIRPVIPTTSGHLNRGIRPPLFSGFEA